MNDDRRKKITRIGGPSEGGTTRKETLKQREAFELYASCRSLRQVADHLGMSFGAIMNWARWFAWDERAEARMLEAARKSEIEAVEEIQKRLDDHRKAGELLRRRGVEHLAKQPIETTRDAIAAIKVGIELERLSVGLPDWVFEVMRMDDEQLEKERVALARLAAAGGPGQPALAEPAEIAVDAEWSETTEGAQPD
jgi:hypothetical protein